jgi:hypothetical protein
MSNRIEINVSNVAGNIIGKLDIGDAEINTVYQLSDVIEPTTKTTNHTKTFTIPGTKNNNQIFQHIYEGGFSSFSYNPNLKLNAQVLVNGNQYFSGNLQLNDIIKVDNKIVGYDITIYGLFGSFFNDIANSKLSDIVNLSDFNHEWTINNIIDSWRLYIYQNGIKVPFNLGNGYVYPLEYKGQVDNRFDAEDFKPAIYTKTIFDRILNSQGITYNSNFLNSSVFKKLILPYVGESDITLTGDQIKNSTTWVKTPETGPGYFYLINGDSKTNKFYPAVRVPFDDTTNLPANDINNNYSVASRSLTIPKNGKYIISARVPMRVFIEDLATDGNTYDYCYFVGGPFEARLRIVNLTTGVTLTSVAETLVDSRFGDGSPHNLPGGTFTEEVVYETSWTGFLNEGEQVAIFIDWWATGSNFTFKFRQANDVGIPPIPVAVKQVNLITHLCVDDKTFTPSGSVYDPYSTGQLTMALVDENLSTGDTIEMNSFLPDIKAVEFIKEINKLFNLYWIQTGNKSFKIEPRNDFYKGGNIHDWTYQVDNAEEIKIEPLYDLQDKKYTLTYSEDNDYYNADYLSSYNEVYGTKNLEVNNDFVVETMEIKSSFAATPTVQHLSSKRMLPAYVKDDNGVKSSTKCKWRILFYGGWIYTPGEDFYIYNKYTNEEDSYSNYPYSGHLDNWENPTNDLSWGTPRKLYFPWKNVTNNNLFNKYWRAQIEEITDKNSHLLTAQIILTEIDMINLDLRDTIQCDNVYYRINKITHNPLNNKAEVELIKAKDYVAFAPSSYSVSIVNDKWVNNIKFGGELKEIFTGGLYNRNGELPTKWQVPYIFDRNSPTINVKGTFTLLEDRTSLFRSDTFGDFVPIKNYYPTKNNLPGNNFISLQAAHSAIGSGNFIDPTSTKVKVNGDRNNIGAKCENITITGNNNEIWGGVKNVSIVGSNQVVKESNTTYIESVTRTVAIVKSTINGGVICGGKNSVSASRIINGGQDRS